MLSIKNIFKSNKKKGASLLEIVVSLGLITLFMIPVGNMVIGTVKINKSSENKQQAGALLQETLEYIKGLKVMPEVGESMVLNNGVTITRTEDKINPNEIFEDGETPKERMHYVIGNTDENEYGFIIHGEIFGEEIITELQDTDSIKEVAGAIYYENKKTWIMAEPFSLSKIIDIKKPERGSDFITNSSLNIERNGNGNFKFDGNKKIDITKDAKDILIFVDGYTSPFNLDVTINGNVSDNNNSNSNSSKKVLIYIYDKAHKIKISDINNNNINATIKIIEASDNTVEGIKINGSTTSLYSIELKAIKNEKLIDSLSADFVK